MRICGTTQQTVRNYLKRLAEMGYVRIEKGRRRGITIVPPEERGQMGKGKRHGSIYPAVPAAVLMKSAKQLITHVKAGDIIRETRNEEEKDWMSVAGEKTYRVMRVYPYHVLTVEKRIGHFEMLLVWGPDCNGIGTAGPGTGGKKNQDAGRKTLTEPYQPKGGAKLHDRL